MAGITFEDSRAIGVCTRNNASRKDLGVASDLDDGNCRIDIHRLNDPLPPLRLKKLLIQTAGVEVGSAATLKL
jgi:hypothetical protein